MVVVAGWGLGVVGVYAVPPVHLVWGLLLLVGVVVVPVPVPIPLSFPVPITIALTVSVTVPLPLPLSPIRILGSSRRTRAAPRPRRRIAQHRGVPVRTSCRKRCKRRWGTSGERHTLLPLPSRHASVHTSIPIRRALLPLHSRRGVRVRPPSTMVPLPIVVFAPSRWGGRHLLLPVHRRRPTRRGRGWG